MSAKKLTYRLMCFVFLTVALGCSKGDENQALAISVTKMGFILPGPFTFPSLDVCYAGAKITEPRYYLPKITTTWTGEGSFLPVILKLEIPESGNIGKNTCTYSGSSTSSSMAYALGFDAATITVGADTSITRDSICSFHCGSLQVKNPAASFTTTVKVKLIGIHTDSENNQRPVTATSTFTLQNIP